MVKIIKTSIVVYTSAQRQKTNPSSNGMSTNISSWDRSFVLMSFLGVKKIFYQNYKNLQLVHSLSAPDMLDVNCLLCSVYLVKAAV